MITLPLRVIIMIFLGILVTRKKITSEQLKIVVTSAFKTRDATHSCGQKIKGNVSFFLKTNRIPLNKKETICIARSTQLVS